MGKQYQSKLDVLIQQSKQRVLKIAVPSEYIGFTGNIKNATFLTQLIYWAERATRADGGVFKTNKQWQAELGLSKQDFINARQKLVDLGFLSFDEKRANGHFTNHYYLDFKALELAFKVYLGLKGETDILDAEIVEENESIKTEIPNKPKTVQRQVATKTTSKVKTPMPKDFAPSEKTMQELIEKGYHPSLLEQYVKKCKNYYTVKHNHHNYPDWDEVFKVWCSKNPKKDANTERLEQIQTLTTEDIFGGKTLDELAEEVYQLRQAENNNYHDSPDEYGRW